MTLAFLALVLKAAIPGGFMIGPAAGGDVRLIPCPEQAHMTMGPSRSDLGPSDSPHHPHRQHPAHSPCAFAGHGAIPLPLGEIVQAIVGVAYAAEIVQSRVDITPGHGLIAPPPPARGPPLFI